MTAQQLSAAELLYRKANDLVPALRERTAETASLGKLPDGTIDAMQAAGFFRILQPARFGGFEMDPEVFFRVQMTLAEGCMSTAWVLGVVAIHNWQLALFDEKSQQDVWGDDASTLISSSWQSGACRRWLQAQRPLGLLFRFQALRLGVPGCHGPIRQ